MAPLGRRAGHRGRRVGAPPTAAALTFVLPSGGRRCFTDAVPPATRVYGEIFVTAAHGSMPVDVVVTSDGGAGAVMYRRENVDHVKFAFTSPAVGGGSGHPAAPRVVDGRDATAARAARAAAAAARAGTSGGGVGGGGGGGGGGGVDGGRGNSGGVGSGGHRRSLLQEDHPKEANPQAHGDDPWADDFSLEDKDWDDPDGAAAAPPPSGPDRSGGGADDSDGFDDAAAWTTTRYEVCVSHSGAVQPAAGVSRRVRLTLSSGSSAHDWGGLALREHLGSLQVALAETAAELDGLTVRMDEVKRREESLARFNSVTGGRVVRAAAVSVGVLLAVSGGQAWAVWRHLNKKKVL